MALFDKCAGRIAGVYRLCRLRLVCRRNHSARSRAYEMNEDINEAAKWWCSHEITAVGGDEDED